ncbi:helix-turn-helix transcriptional regulator [Streptacidiphilus carbonis]|uniref:helix-turn-helix transcriptional regulator n=1 Tax=Streptacidiphilus carbonis TaxID=105422 RepID=UPI0005A6F315|nr:helix-turn-helix transcriptional regulator [Streptacidiphilus carbonis]
MDPDLLRLLMKRAPRGPLTLRDLARETGISRSRLSYLMNGEKPITTADKALRIADAVGTHAGAFFSARLSMSMDVDNPATEDSNGPE